MKMEQGQRDDIWIRVERYLDWKSQMVVATSNLNTAIRALGQAEFGLAGLKGHPRLHDSTLRLELQDHEDRLVQIRDMLIDMQAELRGDARKDFADRTDRMEGDE